MTTPELDLETRMQLVRDLVQGYVNRQGHDRCWYLPELFDKLAKTLDIEPTVQPGLPSREEFEKGCRRYQNEQYLDQKDPPW